MRGEAIEYGQQGTNIYSDGNGSMITDTAPQEELAAVGLGNYNTPKDITENQIRKEQGMNERADY